MKNFLFFLFSSTCKCINEKNNELFQANVKYECNINSLFDVNFDNVYLVPSLEIFFMDFVQDKYVGLNFFLFSNFKTSFTRFDFIINGFLKVKNINEFSLKNKFSVGIILSFHNIINEFINFDIYFDSDKNIKVYYVFNLRIKEKLKGSLNSNIFYFSKKNIKEDINNKNKVKISIEKPLFSIEPHAYKNNAKNQKIENELEHELRNANSKLEKIKTDLMKLSKQIKQDNKNLKLRNDRKNIKKQIELHNRYILVLEEKKEINKSNEYTKQEKSKMINYVNSLIKEIKGEVLFDMKIVVLNK